MLGVDDVGVFLALKFGLLFVGPLKIVEIFEEQDPRCLFGVVKFGSAPSLFPQDIVDILEGLFEHSLHSPDAFLSGRAVERPKNATPSNKNSRVFRPGHPKLSTLNSAELNASPASQFGR